MFLNIEFEEKLYVGQPQDFVIKEAEKKMILYSSKQTVKVWNNHIYFPKNGFQMNPNRLSLYRKDKLNFFS